MRAGTEPRDACSREGALASRLEAQLSRRPTARIQPSASSPVGSQGSPDPCSEMSPRTSKLPLTMPAATEDETSHVPLSC